MNCGLLCKTTAGKSIIGKRQNYIFSCNSVFTLNTHQKIYIPGDHSCINVSENVKCKTVQLMQCLFTKQCIQE